MNRLLAGMESWTQKLTLSAWSKRPTYEERQDDFCPGNVLPFLLPI